MCSALYFAKRGGRHAATAACSFELWESARGSASRLCGWFTMGRMLNIPLIPSQCMVAGGWDMLGYAGMAMFYIVFLMLFDVICLIRSWIVYIRSLIIWWAIWFLHDICPKHRFLGHENEKFLPGSAAGDVNFVVRGRAFL